MPQLNLIARPVYLIESERVSEWCRISVMDCSWDEFGLQSRFHSYTSCGPREQSNAMTLYQSIQR